MSKTLEELAEEYGRSEWPIVSNDCNRIGRDSSIEGFLAGYQAAAPQWISVKDRLPERDLNVLAWIKCGTSEYVFIETASGDPNMCSGWKHYNKDQVTHWMPLPQPPKEEK
jgi:hypothetical protein